MGRRKDHSLGEMISSLTFFGCAVYLVISALEWQIGNDIVPCYHGWLPFCVFWDPSVFRLHNG